MPLNISEHHKLRELFEQSTNAECEATYKDIKRMCRFEDTFEGDEPSWAEWGYVLWLEQQVLELKGKE